MSYSKLAWHASVVTLACKILPVNCNNVVNNVQIYVGLVFIISKSDAQEHHPK